MRNAPEERGIYVFRNMVGGRVMYYAVDSTGTIIGDAYVWPGAGEDDNAIASLLSLLDEFDPKQRHLSIVR